MNKLLSIIAIAFVILFLAILVELILLCFLVVSYLKERYPLEKKITRYETERKQ